MRQDANVRDCAAIGGSFIELLDRGQQRGISMNRHFTACLILFAGLFSIVPTMQARSISDRVQGAATEQAQPPSQTPPVTVIDGRRHPESVPPEIAWEHF